MRKSVKSLQALGSLNHALPRVLTQIVAGVVLSMAAVAAQAQVSLTNADFEAPALATDSFNTFGNLGWSAVQWGSYAMTSKIVDITDNQFAQVVNGDVIWSSFYATTAGNYQLNFDALGDGYFMVYDDTTHATVFQGLVQNTAWANQGSTAFALNTTDNYRLYFGSTLLPQTFSASLNVDNVAITQTAAPVPEPESVAMMLAGLGAIGLMSRRRLKQRG